MPWCFLVFVSSSPAGESPVQVTARRPGSRLAVRSGNGSGPFRKEIFPNGPWITYHAWWLLRLTAGGAWWPPPGSRLGGSPGIAVSRLTRSPGARVSSGWGGRSWWPRRMVTGVLPGGQVRSASVRPAPGEPAVMVISLNWQRGRRVLRERFRADVFQLDSWRPVRPAARRWLRRAVPAGVASGS
jgi:hypothetical protein